MSRISIHNVETLFAGCGGLCPKSAIIDSMLERAESEQTSAKKVVKPKADRYVKDATLDDGDIRHTPSGTMQRVTVSFDNDLNPLQKIKVIRDNYLQVIRYFIRKYRELKSDDELLNTI